MVKEKGIPKEFEQFVEIVYATFNRDLYQNERPIVIKAWYAILGDLEAPALRERFLELATISKVMPTPVAIRRHVLASTVAERLLSPPEAWAHLQDFIKQVNSGAIGRTSINPQVAEAMRRLGDTALSLSTNGDREYFMEIYREIYDRELMALYKVGS